MGMVHKIKNYLRGKTKRSERELNAYNQVVRSVISEIEGEKDQKKALEILSGEKAQEAYDILAAHEIPENAIKRIMSHSLYHFQRGRGLTEGSYTLGIAGELAQSEKYADVVRDMYVDGVISEKGYSTVQKDISKYSGERSKNLRKRPSGLEKIAASIFGVFGIGTLIASGTRITGGIIGTVNANSNGLILGIVMLVLSLSLFLRSFKN